MKKWMLCLEATCAFWLFMASADFASAFYDPTVQRWINRDPIEEHGGFNLSGFVDNDPTGTVDGSGLTIYICARKSEKPPSCPMGNHVYFYDDSQPPYSQGGHPSCGMSSSSGRGTPGNPEKDKGPGTDDCKPITDDASLGNAIMQCCQATANTGIWLPFINDCHNKVNNCLKHFHIKPPCHPRTGPPVIIEFPQHRPPARPPRWPYGL